MSKEALQFYGRVTRSGLFDLSMAERFALHVLAIKHSHGQPLQLPISRIASSMGSQKPVAHRAVSGLISAGLIIVENDHRRGRRTARTYRFPADWDIPGSAEQWLDSIRRGRSRGS